MPDKKQNTWPIVKEKKSRIGNPAIRKLEIKDARNTWIIESVKTDKVVFDIVGFRDFYFTYDGKELECYKREIVRKSDSGKVACFDDRFNLVDENGERKTLRLKNLKKYLKDIFEC